MIGFGLIIGVVALAVVIVVDIVVRLVVAPHRHDQWTASLLDSLIEPAADEQQNRNFPVGAAMDETLCESLLLHFEQSVASRQILAVLAEPGGGLLEAELQGTVNRQLRGRRRRELPVPALRQVTLILKRAGLVASQRGRWELTIAGKRLQALLEARATAPAAGGRPAPVSALRAI